MASIFTKIRNGELPGHFVWRDEHCFAIMTIQPIREGHLLVIPNDEVDHWDDLPEETAAHLMQVSRHIAKALKQIIPCRRIGVSIVGLEVPHTHIHLIPIDSMSDMDFAHARTFPPEKLAEMADKIRAQLRAQGHEQADLN